MFFLLKCGRERHMQELMYRLGQRQEKKGFGIHCWTSAGSSCGTEVKIFEVQMWFALVPEHRLFGLPGLSQTIAFNWSLKSIGAVIFMAHWLLLKVSVL